VSSTPQSATSVARLPSLYQFFGPGGVLARTLPAYEFRRGQLQMAESVEQAIEERRHLIVEAGTGTGKTLAYLLPVIRSGKRVIISTGTKTLQEQLFFKDVPFLQSHLGELRVCYMKGRGNYLCRKKLYDLADQPILNGLEEISHFKIITEWEKTTESGDRAELSELPENSPLWPRLDARTDRCIGTACQQFERCFITEMRRKAAESDIIIVNHHLFCADLAIKAEAEYAPDAGVLPSAQAVIFDEAHQLENVVGDYFGVSVSNLGFDDLLRDVDQAARKSDVPAADILSATASVRQHSQLFFASLPSGDGRFAFEDRAEFLEERGDHYSGLQNALLHLHSLLYAVKEKPDDIYGVMRRVDELAAHLRFLLEDQSPNIVFWIERRGGGHGRHNQNVFLQATPIDVSSIFREILLDRLDTVVFTSATLAVSGGFEYLRSRLGLDHAREQVIPSHFDYESQSLLYVPRDLPEPMEPHFPERAAEVIRQLLEITSGRAFCLFTSYRLMKDLHERLFAELPFPLLLQGDAPKKALLEEFRLTPNAVLFATASFWQGVDVQGEQLSCVIIDRLPFAVPNDPIVAARVKAIAEAGGNAFYEYQVPSAVISLKQGFGRLIRSLHDRGLLCLLDNRILKKQYGRVFLDSLPNYSRTTDLRQVREFFGRGAGEDLLVP
jgi:ATP-dependent DNA helicase DinG